MRTELPLGQRAPTLRQIVELRATVEAAVRAYFNRTGATEVSTPTMVASPGMEPHLRAFPIDAAECHELGRRYLHTSPEYAIKSVFGALGFDVFCLARCYRDEPPGRLHHAEFTMLEWYRRGEDLELLMRDCEELVAIALACATRLSGGEAAPVAEQKRFGRVRCDDAFQRYAGVDLTIPDDVAFARAARAAGFDVGADWDWDSVFTVIQADSIEPAITQHGPVFLTHFPARQAGLAKLDPDDSRWALRFELYAPGVARVSEPGHSFELANAFAELLDACEQRARFASELRWREANGRTLYPMPEDMLHGIDQMASTVGIALGFERLLVWAVEQGLGWHLRVADWLLAEPLRSLR